MFGNEETKKLLKAVSFFLIIVSVFFVIKGVGEIKSQRFIGSGTTSTNTISVSGEGLTFATPDIASVSFTVRESAKTVKEASETVNTKMNEALSFVRESKVLDDDIKTTNNSFYPKYDYGAPCYGYPCPSQEPKIIGYEVSRTVTIKIRDTDTAGAIVDGLASRGVTELSGPTFTIDDEDIINEEARRLAIEDAREKAEILAKDLGVTLIRIVGFSESNGGYPVSYMRPEADMAMGSATKEEMADLPMGQNEYRSSVTIIYEIR